MHIGHGGMLASFADMLLPVTIHRRTSTERPGVASRPPSDENKAKRRWQVRQLGGRELDAINRDMIGRISPAKMIGAPQLQHCHGQQQDTCARAIDSSTACTDAAVAGSGAEVANAQGADPSDPVAD